MTGTREEQYFTDGAGRGRARIWSCDSTGIRSEGELSASSGFFFGDRARHRGSGDGLCGVSFLDAEGEAVSFWTIGEDAEGRKNFTDRGCQAGADCRAEGGSSEAKVRDVNGG